MTGSHRATRTGRRASRRGRGPGSGAFRALLSVGIVLGLGGVATMATWTSAATVAPGSVTAGSFDLTLNDQLAGDANRDGTTTSTSIDVASLLPGESRAFTVSVKNVGDVAAVYRVVGQGSGALLPALRWTVYAGGTATNTSTSTTSDPLLGFRTGTCAGGTVAGPTDVTLGSAASPASLVPSQRSLAVGGATTLCVVTTMDSSATTISTAAYRNATASATLVVRGAQTGAP